MPGYTHLQRAQPVTVGHHLLAWVEMLERDLVRFAAAAAAAAASPLGRRARRVDCRCLRPESAPQLARRRRRPRLRARLPLRGRGLLRPLSRIGEELVLWTTASSASPASPSAATGSSMMPQKLNPDVAELARARRARRSGA